ncbi:unnamed protein product [Chrysodeixis includens]|uniref:Uncharacterized protein n=1 Tax=Chrysodeixis includens TaxID=689277 RepID=A0A9P0FPS4_CHRIL|nr:unnamed protein product [Chrysodeixis includens]
MNVEELSKNSSQHPYYPCNKYSEELGLIETEEASVQKEWTSQTTLWMIVFALLLWLLTYLMVMALTMCFDISFRTLVGFTGLVPWYNETSLMTNDDITRYVVIL